MITDELIAEIKQFFPLTQIEPAKKIYHYTSGEGLKGILENKNVWFTDIKHLNDSSEFIHTLNIFEEVLQELYKNNKNDFWKSILEGIKSDRFMLLEPTQEKDIKLNESGIIRRYYVASFSTNQDNLLMWRYYTKSKDYKGYNIGFIPIISIDDQRHNLMFDSHSSMLQDRLSTENSMKNSKMEYSPSRKIIKGYVNYDENILKKSIQSYLEYKYNEYLKIKKTDKYIDMTIVLLKLYEVLRYISVFNKHKGFEQEEEYRFVAIDTIIKEANEELEIREKFRNSEQGITPYIEQFFSEYAVKSIITSHSNNNSQLDGIKRMINNYGYRDVNVSTSKIPLRY